MVWLVRDVGGALLVFALQLGDGVIDLKDCQSVRLRVVEGNKVSDRAIDVCRAPKGLVGHVCHSSCVRLSGSTARPR